MSITFTVNGNPIPKDRPRVILRGNKAHAFTPAKTRRWEQEVAQAARLAMGDREPLAGDICVLLSFYRADARRADLDNLAKAVLDAIQAGANSPGGIVFEDDAQIVELHAYKAIDRERPRAVVWAWNKQAEEGA